VIDLLRRGTLAFLKVPAQPHPPAGDPASLRVFHAGRNHLRLQLAGWALTQLLALAGIVFWATLLLGVEQAAHGRRASGAAPIAAGPTAAPAERAAAPAREERRIEKWPDRLAERIKGASQRAVNRHRGQRFASWAEFKEVAIELGMMLPDWAFPLVWAVKIVTFILYLAQIPITYAVRRLDYEMRWYMVTDRSLRLRHGIWKVTESTMSFANIQQVEMSQGPVQRLLGLGDVRVQSAGGGSPDPKHEHGEDMHLGLFHNVSNAEEIRELVLARLRRFRESGLGDPEETPAGRHDRGEPAADALSAAREVLRECRALRTALS
jgi:membrane protein YdbS with pleckstrin-like domain